MCFIADGYGAGTEAAPRTYLDQFLGGGFSPLMISPFRGHSEAVAYLMSKAGADANVSALMYLRRPGTKNKFYEPSWHRLSSEYDVQTARFMLISRVQTSSSMMYSELVMLTYPVLLNPSTPLKNLARVWHASGTRLARA